MEFGTKIPDIIRQYIEVRPGVKLYSLLHKTSHPQGPAKRPLIIWLQGGAGQSSVGIGYFEEIGPIDGDKEERKYTWISECSVLFIDSPVGSGFSIKSDRNLWPADRYGIANDLLSMIKVFFNSSPEFQSVPLYIIGESYSSTIAALLAVKLHEKIVAGEIECNLEGIGLGAAWISTVHILNSYAKVWKYNTNMSDSDAKKTATYAEEYMNAVKDNLPSEKAKIVLDVFNHISESTNRSVNSYNLKQTEDQFVKSYIKIPSPALKEESDFVHEHYPDDFPGHEAALPGSYSVDVHFMNDYGVADSYKFVETILQETELKVTFYNGDLDGISPSEANLALSMDLEWKGKDGFKLAEFKSFPGGRSRMFEKLAFFEIYDAGHCVATDQPEACYNVLKYMIKDD